METFFAAIMTTALIVGTEISPVIIGISIGIASSTACYLDLKKYLKAKDNSDLAH